MTILINSTPNIQHTSAAARYGLSNLVSFYHQRATGFTEKNPSILRLSALTTPGINSLYLDSGVFSARKKFELLELDELISFYHLHAQEINYVFTLDQGSYEEWIRNTQVMKDQGVPVIGITRADMSFDEIKRTEEASCSYVALAAFGIVNSSREGYSQNLIRAYHRLRSILEPETKIHLLGVFRHNVLQQCLPYSTDASSVSKVSSYGKLINWSPQRGIYVEQPTVAASSRHDITRARYNYQKLLEYQHYLTALRSRMNLTS